MALAKSGMVERGPGVDERKTPGSAASRGENRKTGDSRRQRVLGPGGHGDTLQRPTRGDQERGGAMADNAQVTIKGRQVQDPAERKREGAEEDDLTRPTERTGKNSKEDSEGGGDGSAETDTKKQRTERLVANVYAPEKNGRSGGGETTTTVGGGPQTANERNEKRTRPNTNDNRN